MKCKKSHLRDEMILERRGDSHENDRQAIFVEDAVAGIYSEQHFVRDEPRRSTALSYELANANW